MELSLKSKYLKKKCKKKKNHVSDNVLLPLIKPDSFDGICNWSRLQEVMGPLKVEELKKQMETKTNQYSKDKWQTSSLESNNMKNIIQNSQEEEKRKVESGNGIILNEFSENKSDVQSHKFSFNASSINNSPKRSPDKDKRNKYAEKRLTKAVAMDCEMVGTGPQGESSIIARVSIVNAYGVCLYDEFVKPKERVTDFRTKISGVRPSDLKRGKELFEVQRDVLNIIEGRILVGHSIKHDLDVLFLSHPRHLIRDTSLYKPFRDLCHGKTPSLKKLTSIILGCEIQSGEHSSVEDAQATMLLYLRQKKEWEGQIKAQRKRKPRVFVNTSFKLN